MQKRALVSTILSALLALTLGACGSPSSPGATDGGTNQTTSTHEVTDTTGRTVSLPEEVQRIVVLDPADAEIVCALGAKDKLVGRSEWCDYPADIQDVPVVASGAETNIEEILGLDPDLVLMSTMAQSSEVVDQLSATLVPTLVFETTTIEGIYDNIRALGDALGQQSQANTIIDDMKSKLAHAGEVAAAHASADAPVIYFEVSPLEYGLWTAGADTFMQEAADLLGATNAFGDLSGWASVSEEQVIDRAPTYIVTTSTAPDAVAEIESRTAWQKIPAVSTHRILAVPNDMFTRPGPRVADAIVMLAEFMGEDD